MGASNHPLRPRTLTMMGGPIDTREAPTAVNDHATKRPHDWFIHNVIATVPTYYKGAGRRVYPGFLQLSGFMSINLAIAVSAIGRCSAIWSKATAKAPTSTWISTTNIARCAT